MMERFAPEGFEDPMAELVATKQLGTVEPSHGGFKEEFLQVLKANQILILVSEASSSKTNQITQFVLEAVETENPGKRRKLMIACTRPQRVAARRVAEEMGVTIGEEVGCSIHCSSARTVLK
ncbi:hypothetical protein V6N13_045424 [Hibiscus sabdariffa]